MIRTFIPVVLWVLVAVVAFASVPSHAAVVKQPKPVNPANPVQKVAPVKAKLDPKTRAQNDIKIRRIVIQLRKSYADAKKLTDLLEQLFNLGDRGKKVALFEIDRALKELLDAYRKAYMARAVQLTRAKYLQNRKEITSKRRKVLAALHQRHEFSEKEINEIVKQVGEIDDLAFVTQKEVRQSSKKLFRTGISIDALASQRIFIRKHISNGSGKQTGKTLTVSDLVDQIEKESVTASRFSRSDNSTNSKNESAASAALAALSAGGTQAIGTDLENTAVRALNNFRNSLGLHSLIVDSNLSAASRDHSKDMATLGFFSHTSPVNRKSQPWDRARLFGTTASAENIAKGFPDPNRVTEGWIGSPGHRRNMVGPYSRVGVGYYRVGHHWTQMFGR